MAAPRPRISDHLRVAGLLLVTLLGAVPFLLYTLVAPVAAPLVRRRMRRWFAGAAETPVEPPPPDLAAWGGKTVFVVAGEESGDRLAARVARAMRGRVPALRIRGYGGPALAAAGAALDRSIVDRAVVGFFGVVRSLPYWWRLCAETLAIFRDDPPDLLLTVDFPGLNLRLARWARRRGIRTVHLVAPQTWAWASWRLDRMTRAVDRLLVTFPFEATLFRPVVADSEFVGHPLFEAPLPPPRSRDAWTSPERDGDAAPLVELRPGSRARDVRRQAPIVLAAAAALSRRLPSTRFVVRLASPKGEAAFQEALAAAREKPERLSTHVGDAPASEPLALAITTSGTSTAELAAAQVPMVVFYRVPAVVGRLGSWLYVTSPWFAMANLLAGREAVPERLVTRGGGRVLADEAASLLLDRARWEETRAALGVVRARLEHPDVADRAARAILAAPSP
jgi:lipid-A-disaccharide synthase